MKRFNSTNVVPKMKSMIMIVMSVVMCFLVLTPNAFAEGETSSTESDVDIDVKTLWYPVDSSGNVIDNVTIGDYDLQIYPVDVDSSKVDQTHFAKLEKGFIEDEKVMFYLNPATREGVFDWKDKKHLNFSDQFGRVDYYAGSNSKIHRITYGDDVIFEASDGSQPKADQKLEYDANKILKFYIEPTKDGLSAASFKKQKVEVNLNSGDNEIRKMLYDNLSFVAMTDYDYKFNGGSIIYLENQGENFLTDIQVKLPRIFLYKYDSLTANSGNFIQDGNQNVDFGITSFSDLESGKYEVVFPIYWNELPNKHLRNVAKYYRTRYNLFDSIHYTIEIKNDIKTINIQKSLDLNEVFGKDQLKDLIQQYCDTNHINLAFDSLDMSNFTLDTSAEKVINYQCKGKLKDTNEPVLITVRFNISSSKVSVEFFNPAESTSFVSREVNKGEILTDLPKPAFHVGNDFEGWRRYDNGTKEVEEVIDFANTPITENLQVISSYEFIEQSFDTYMNPITGKNDHNQSYVAAPFIVKRSDIILKKILPDMSKFPGNNLGGCDSIDELEKQGVLNAYFNTWIDGRKLDRPSDDGSISTAIHRCVYNQVPSSSTTSSGPLTTYSLRLMSQLAAPRTMSKSSYLTEGALISFVYQARNVNDFDDIVVQAESKTSNLYENMQHDEANKCYVIPYAVTEGGNYIVIFEKNFVVKDDYIKYTFDVAKSSDGKTHAKIERNPAGIDGKMNVVATPENMSLNEYAKELKNKNIDVTRASLPNIVCDDGWEVDKIVSDRKVDGRTEFTLDQIKALKSNSDVNFTVKLKDSSKPSPKPDHPTVSTTLTVTFNSKGGTDVQTQYLDFGDKAIRPKDPVKDGYEFEGWYIEQVDLDDLYRIYPPRNEETQVLFDFDTRISKDITLYAKWKPVEKPVVPQKPEKPSKPEEHIPESGDPFDPLVNGILLLTTLVLAGACVTKMKFEQN